MDVPGFLNANDVDPNGAAAPVSQPQTYQPEASSSVETQPIYSSAMSTDPRLSVPRIPSVHIRRLSGFSPLESGRSYENLLTSMLSRMDAGFDRINESLRILNNRSSLINVHSPVESQGAILQQTRASVHNPVEQQNCSQNLNSEQSRRNNNPQPPPNHNNSHQSIPHHDSVARLERMVGSLPSQVQNLTERMSTTSGFSQRNGSDATAVTQSSHATVSSYKTYPHKWKLFFNGNNNTVSIEFFLDNVKRLKENK